MDRNFYNCLPWSLFFFPFKKSITNSPKIFSQHLKLSQSRCGLKRILIFASYNIHLSKLSFEFHPIGILHLARERERERSRQADLKRDRLVGRPRTDSIGRWYIYLQGEMSGSLDVFVWHIRHTMEPTETRLRVSLCCWPSPRDICCVSQSFKLQDEPSGTVTGSIGMPCSWSKLTGIEEKDTQGAGAYVWSTPPTRLLTPPIPRNGRLSAKSPPSNID